MQRNAALLGRHGRPSRRHAVVSHLSGGSPLSSRTRTHITVLTRGVDVHLASTPAPAQGNQGCDGRMVWGRIHYSWSHASHRVAVGDKHLEELLEAASDRAVEEGATLVGGQAHGSPSTAIGRR